jgi:hypothetical protein
VLRDLPGFAGGRALRANPFDVGRLLFSGSTRCVTHLPCPIFLKREGENSYRTIYSEVSLSVPC